MRISGVYLRSVVAMATCVLLLLQISGPAHTKARPIGTLAPQAMGAPDVDHLISEFTRQETELRAALDQHKYKCDLLIQTIRSGKPNGEFHRVVEVYPGPNGKPAEKVLSFPGSTLREITVTPRDLEELSAGHQFTLDAANANKYKLVYTGSEKLDTVDTYIFEVRPKDGNGILDPFNGRIWVSAKDLRIVRLRGRWEQNGSNRAPVITIFRKPVEGGYLFPSHALADERLTFQNGRSAQVRIEILYTDYVKQP